MTTFKETPAERHSISVNCKHCNSVVEVESVSCPECSEHYRSLGISHVSTGEGLEVVIDDLHIPVKPFQGTRLSSIGPDTPYNLLLDSGEFWTGLDARELMRKGWLGKGSGGKKLGATQGGVKFHFDLLSLIPAVTMSVGLLEAAKKEVLQFLVGTDIYTVGHCYDLHVGSHQPEKHKVASVGWAVSCSGTNEPLVYILREPALTVQDFFCKDKQEVVYTLSFTSRFQDWLILRPKDKPQPIEEPLIPDSAVCSGT